MNNYEAAKEFNIVVDILKLLRVQSESDIQVMSRQGWKLIPVPMHTKAAA